MERVNQYFHFRQIHDAGITGKNVQIAILDTGIYPHVDLAGRIIVFRDFINHNTQYYDDNGHGTHVAGIIAGDGTASSGRYCGIAPDSNIIALKVLDKKGTGKVSHVVEGLNWILEHRREHKIRIVNISIGSISQEKVKEDSILVESVNRLWDAGIVVVVAAGNNGPKRGSVTVPGVSRKVITVGSSDDNLATIVFGNRRVDYSGRGPTQSCVVKPEIVALGGKIRSCQNARIGYTIKSGTSMATPIVSGAIALLLEKYPDMKPKDVKMKLYQTARDLGRPKSQQGWGEIHIEKLLL